MKNYLLSLLALLFLTGLSACGDDEEKKEDEQPPFEFDFYSPRSTGWTDEGDTCYWVLDKDELPSGVRKGQYVFVFDSNGYMARCKSAVLKMRCETENDAVNTVNYLSTQNYSATKSGYVVSAAVDSYANMTKVQVKNSFIDDDPVPDSNPEVEINAENLTGEWLMVRYTVDLDGEVTTTEFKDQKWQLNADGSAVWSYQSTSDQRWYPTDYSWSVYTHAIMMKEKGGGGNSQTWYISQMRKNSMTWTSDEPIDGKPCERTQMYQRITE